MLQWTRQLGSKFVSVCSLRRDLLQDCVVTVSIGSRIQICGPVGNEIADGMSYDAGDAGAASKVAVFRM